MPKEITISDIYDMRVGEPIDYLRAGVKSIGDRRHGASQFKDKPEWSFQGVTIYDLDYPDDTIVAMFKDCPPVPDEYVGQVIIFEASKSNTGLKAEDDVNPKKDAPPERVLWVTRSAHVCTEEEAAPSRETRRTPARETRAPARESRPPAREEPVRTRRREPEPEPVRRREPEPTRTREPDPRREEPRREESPRQQQPQQQRRHVEPSPKLQFFQMSLMFIEAHKAARYAAEEIVREEQKTNPDFEMPWIELCSIRSSLAIAGFQKNLHTQMRAPAKPKPEPSPEEHHEAEPQKAPDLLPPPEESDESADDQIPY